MYRSFMMSTPCRVDPANQSTFDTSTPPHLVLHALSHQPPGGNNKDTHDPHNATNAQTQFMFPDTPRLRKEKKIGVYNRKKLMGGGVEEKEKNLGMAKRGKEKWMYGKYREIFIYLRILIYSPG